MTEKIDKSKIISPYLCKHTGEIKEINKNLDKIDKKIDMLIDINSQLQVHQEKLSSLEKRQNEITTRLWYICGGSILAIISTIIQMLT